MELFVGERDAKVLEKFLQRIVAESLEWIASSFCRINCEDWVKINVKLLEYGYFTMSS